MSEQDDFYYLTVDEIVSIHRNIIEEDPKAEPGIGDRGDIEYVVDHLEYGSFGEGPRTIHEKAFHLMRLLAANHPFVDGNKRTAMGSAMMFYFMNGYELEDRDELESQLILISIREDYVDPEAAIERLSIITNELSLIDYLPGLSDFAEEHRDELDTGVGPVFLPTEHLNLSSDNSGEEDE